MSSIKNQNKKEDEEPKNLYSLIYSNTKSNSLLDKLLDDTNTDDDLLDESNIISNNIMILDKKSKEIRDKRIYEKDKEYKIKKHYFLKESYKLIVKDDYIKCLFDQLKEQEYLKKCEIAENKLYIGNELNAQDTEYIIKRNYYLFKNTQKQVIDIYQKSFKIYYSMSIIGTLIITSYLRSIMLYFKFELKNRYYSYLFLFCYGLGIYYSINVFLNKSYVNQFRKIIYNNKDNILNPNNTRFKIPYGVDKKDWDPEKESQTDLLNFE